eukprot:3843604-Pleurochrysis_carterae.AAC.1
MNARRLASPPPSWMPIWVSLQILVSDIIAVPLSSPGPPPPSPANPPACPPGGVYNGSVRVFIDFGKSEILYSNLGGYGPNASQSFLTTAALFNPPGADPDASTVSTQGIYYAGIGVEVVDEVLGDGKVASRNVNFDMYVYNTTAYFPNPNTAVQSIGKSAGSGDLGAINLADNQECDFDFMFVDSETGSLLALSQPFSFVFLDFDAGIGGKPQEYLQVCGIESYDTSISIYGVPTAILVKDLGSGCFEFASLVEAGSQNNPQFVSDILVPLSSMSNFVREDVLPILVVLNFPAGLAKFQTTYIVTASNNP